MNVIGDESMSRCTTKHPKSDARSRLTIPTLEHRHLRTCLEGETYRVRGSRVPWSRAFAFLSGKASYRSPSPY